MVTGLAGCVSRQQEEAAEARGEAVMDYHELSMLPDSAMTAEQLALKKQLERITIMNMEASGDEEVFAVEREYFIEHGIPVEYYDSIQKQVDRNNALWQCNIEHFGDVENLDLAASIKEAREAYLKYIEEVGEDGMSYQEYCRLR